MNINEQHNSYQPCVKTQWIWGRQEKKNEKNQCFKGWETLVNKKKKTNLTLTRYIYIVDK